MARGNLAGHGPVNIAAFTADSKASPVNADQVIIIDSEDSGKLKLSTADSLPGGGTTGWAGSVANYAALPAATGSGDVYLVENSTGFLWAQKKGLYQDNGTWERLSNATFEVLDSEATFSDDGDNNKKMDFQLSGITTGNTRTITMLDSDIDLGNVVQGPASATGNRVAVFDGATGKLVKDGGAGTNISDIQANNTHRTSDGSDHTYLNQSVTTSASPSFAGVTSSGDVDLITASNADIELKVQNSVQDWALRTSSTSGDLSIRKGASSVFRIDTDWVDGRFVDFEEAKVTFNPEGFNRDFIVEGDTNTTLLNVDAGLDMVGVGKSVPSKLLHVGGEAQFDDNITVSKAGTAGFTITDTTNGTGLLNAGAEFDFRWSKTTGSAIMDFEPKSVDGTSECQVRFGINSGSTGANKLVLFDSNGTNRQMEVSTTGATYVCRQRGYFVVGSNARLSDGVLSVHGAIVNQPDTGVTLANNGDFEISCSSNTSVEFNFRGSDGTTRSASLTLA